jgi:hypothetical protein
MRFESGCGDARGDVGLVEAVLVVDVVGEGVDGDGAEPADVDGLNMAVGEQHVEARGSSDAEPLSGLGDGGEASSRIELLSTAAEN